MKPVTKMIKMYALEELQETVSRLLYHWDETTQGLILSSFYWGYFVSNIAGGIFAERFYCKYGLGLGVLGTSLLSLFTPIIITSTKGHWIVLVAVRVMDGLCQGIVFPAVHSILAHWIPEKEKSTILRLCYSGGHFGTIISILGGGRIIGTTKSWSSIYYLFGSLGVIWFVFWQLLCYSDPDTHPFIGEEEASYLHEELGFHITDIKNMPWTSIFSSVPIWALIIEEIGYDWGWFIMVTELPKYMKDVLKFNIEDNALWCSLPFVSLWIMSVATGFLSDFLVNKKCFTVTTVRKVFASIGNIGPAGFFLLASYEECDRVAVVASFSAAASTMSAYYSGVKVNPLDLSPNFAGILMGLINGLGIISGIIAPSLIAIITPDRTVQQWRYVFWISSYIYAFSNVVFIIFGSGVEQPWNNIAQK